MPKCFNNSRMLNLSQSITSFSFQDNGENILLKLLLILLELPISACSLARSLERLSVWKLVLSVMLNSSADVRRQQDCLALAVLGEEA